MNITERLQQLDPTLVLHNEGCWNVPFNPEMPGYTSFNDAGVETEVGEFLYAMVRILKPEYVLETGTHWGISTVYMGQALMDNKIGKLDTIEFIPENYKKAEQRIIKLSLGVVVNMFLMDVAKFEPSFNYEFIFLDTEPQTRFAELIKFEPFLQPGGFIFIHDLHRHMHQIENIEHGFAWPFGKVPQEIINLVKNDKLRPFHFGTPRGLTGFYKPHPGDYKW